MQIVNIVSFVSLLIGLANLLIILTLVRQTKVPETLLQIPDRLSRLEALYQQAVEAMSGGFRDSRGENLTALNLVRESVDKNLEKTRNDFADFKNASLQQIKDLSTTFAERLSSFTAATSSDSYGLKESINQKFEDSSSKLRSDLQGQIGTMQTTLTAQFTDLSTRSSDADATLQSVVHSDLESIANSFKKDSEALRAVLENSFNDLRSAVTDSLNSSEQKQTLNGNALQETVERAFSRLSSQVKDSLESQEKQLTDVSSKTDSALAELRRSVSENLKSISETNEKKLEQMRETVDEKLHSTLEKRLADNFSMVTDQLGKVQTGLGEMKDLASNVGDLKKVLTNVKSRGGFAELQLGAQLKNALAPNQYKENVRVKPDTTESVEFAICLPGDNEGECLIPLDAKFPKEPWERLENAREAADQDEVKRASTSFEAAIRIEAKRISEKYINPPTTTNFGVMYLPTEALFSEVVRNPVLLEEIQTKFRIAVAGPTTLMALLISFQMGFQTLAIQKKGAEVWNILAAAKVQFGKFGDLMSRVERNVGKVQQTLQDIGTRTRPINRTLSGVDTVAVDSPSAKALLDLAAQPLPDGFEDESPRADVASAGN